MSKFKVTYCEKVWYSIEVEADTKEQAEEMVSEMDINELGIDDSETIENYNAEEIYE